MKVALIHTSYVHKGGEESVFEAESALLADNGIDVVKYEVANEELNKKSRFEQVRITIWNHEQFEKLQIFFRNERPDIAHFHNTFPLISPSAYYAAQEANVPVVQTLHNYRLLCANGLFYRDNHVCEDCLGKRFPLPALMHRCYRGSLPATAAVVAMQVRHRRAKTYRDRVHAYIALTEFAKGKFVAGGLPEDRLHVKPNFLSPDPGIGSGSGGYALYVGRLSFEKGTQTLVDAWRAAPDAMPLRIVGDGPDASIVESIAGQPNVSWLGKLAKEQVLAQMRNASVLIFPSVCYENLPLVIPEAYACGLPVLATDLPSLDSLVFDGITGFRFKCGDPSDLARKVEELGHKTSVLQAMRHRVREEFELKYTAEKNLETLLRIYESARATSERG